MNITTLSVEGPAIDARLPLPCPAEATIRPYPWSDFLVDMGDVLMRYSLSADFAEVEGTLEYHTADDGTCYWIRADLDTGSRYLRVYACRDDRGDMTLALASCTAGDVPGRLRLN